MDLVEAKKLTPGSHVLVLNPDIEIIRADGIFLDELIAAAQQLKAPVELSGSILGHAYYMLRRAGLTVIASGEPSYSRVRGKRQFAKLVRDRVPDQINKQGETTVLAQIPRQEARAALIIKLFEEAHELLIARSPEEVEGELADIFEVVRGLAAATGVSWVDVEQTAKEKRDKRGGFENGTVLMETAWSPTQKRRRAPQKVSLSALARKSEIGQSIQINFAALIAAGANRAVTLPDGSIYEINLTATGLQLTRVNSANDAAEQLTLPGMIKDH